MKARLAPPVASSFPEIDGEESTHGFLFDKEEVVRQGRPIGGCALAYAAEGAGPGIQMTSWAFSTVFPWFPVVLSFIAVLFAFSTMISWSYYGEQCWAHLFGVRWILVYKAIFLIFAWCGALFEANAVVDFGDMMILGMAFPNLLGVMMLSGRVKADLDGYLGKLRAGEFTRIP